MRQTVVGAASYAEVLGQPQGAHTPAGFLFVNTRNLQGSGALLSSDAAHP
ncbi:MAG: hypothetical protein QOJ15_7217 [Bradyrhizobium sp.]|jgi:hypothetical protein|nr:hypothetical protein [Bradyrhizobium sp.]